jgi:lipoprotein-anchoring transpeptidase ErfK/SrfK
MNLPSPISPRTRCAPYIARLALAAGALVVLLAASPAGASPYGTGARANARTLPYPHHYTLTNPKIAHWAVVVHNVSAHAEPNAHSKVITTLNTVTGDGTQNLVLILDGVDLSSKTTWYHVRLAILPNNSTGWVPRSALGSLYTVHTHLYINRETETAVLTKYGKPIFTTRVGVGRTYWPTPRGQFYVRDKLTDFHNAFYGPLAFGTSARSSILTDWPGGGFIGIHGTNEPSLIPGHISHGCIRVVNSQILKLARLIKVGSPVTIT